MIRPFTAICVLLAGASGLYLYTEKHRTTVLDQQISKIVQDTQHIRERTAMLRAEWALLNQPDRLQSLSARFLPDLHPMAPTQFVQMATLARHLPEVAPPPVTAQLSPDATVLAPIQVMARQMTSPAGDAAREPAETDPSETDSSLAEARPAPRLPTQLAGSALTTGAAAAAAAARHPVQRTHVPVRTAGLLRPVPTAAAAPVAAPVRTVQASRMAGYDGAPMRTLVSTPAVTTGGASYLHPAPMQAAAWRMTTRPSYSQTVATVQPVGHSSLGFAHASMPAPVPLDGD